MLKKIINLYVFLFGRTRFQKFNKSLYRLSLGGLGVLNHETSRVSGERHFLKNCLTQKSQLLIDVGANQGNYSLEAISICPTLKVFAFEPHPITFSSLSKNVAQHKNIQVLNEGVGSESGLLSLYDYPNNDGSSHASLFQDVITQIHGAGSAVSHEVHVTTLDEFLRAESIDRIDLLKIDTEGNELEVLRGAEYAIREKRIKMIHFEFNEMNVTSRAFFRDFWVALGDYRFFRLLPNGMLEIKKYNPLICEIFAYQNIVAVLKD